MLIDLDDEEIIVLINGLHCKYGFPIHLIKECPDKIKNLHKKLEYFLEEWEEY